MTVHILSQALALQSGCSEEYVGTRLKAGLVLGLKLASPRVNVFKGEVDDAFIETKRTGDILECTVASDAVLAEISLRSPRKLFIFIIKKYIYRIRVPEKIII